MKHIKKFESFDYAGFISSHIDIIKTVGVFAVMKLIGDIGTKLLKNHTSIKRLKSMLNNPIYVKRNWTVRESDDLIEMIQKVGAGSREEIAFIINKKKRTLEYISDIYPLNIKLQQNEYNELINGINYIKQLSENIEDLFFDLKDKGLSIKLRKSNFVNKSFSISIYKGKGLESFTLKEIHEDIDILIDRIKIMFNATIDENYQGDTYDDVIIKSTPVGKRHINSTITIPFIQK
jgi:hypothetical protein